MTRNIINIGAYKYLIEYFNADTDLIGNQRYARFVMLRNFTILNNLIYDTDIYFIERQLLEEYIEELIDNETYYGNKLAFPITNLKVNSYSNTYKKFNNVFDIYEDNVNDSLYVLNKNTEDPQAKKYKFSNNIYELLSINDDHTINYNKQIKCDKIKLYHPLTKRNLNMLIDVCNYINGINFHYLCRPLNNYSSKTDTEIKIDNEVYSEYIELYIPNIDDIFKVDEEGNYQIFYKEDFNIIASTQNEKFINKILSNSKEIEHAENIEGSQIVPINLLIQPYRIVEEYAADSEFNYNNTVADDEKIFAKLYLKHNIANDNNTNSNLSIILYPYSEVDEHTNIYLLHRYLMPGYSHSCGDAQFYMMSRTAFNNGIISIVSLFNYPNKSYFYNRYKNDDTTSPIKEAYKYYYNVKDEYYNMFMNDEIAQELNDIDAVEDLSPETMKTVKELVNPAYIDEYEALELYKKIMSDKLRSEKGSSSSEVEQELARINAIKTVDNSIIQTVKKYAHVNYADRASLLAIWKKTMKETILLEYEEDFHTPTNFLGFKIQIATDKKFKHIIYDKNVRVNFSELDDFAFNLNNIFHSWTEKPDMLIARIIFYDRLLGIDLASNLVIITKEWFKYLINDTNRIYRLTDLSLINKKHDNIDMKVVNLTTDNEINKLNALKESLAQDITNANKLNAYNSKIEEIISDLENEVNTNKVNFINNIKCIVNKQSSSEQNVSNYQYKQKIIFKPIFYKVKDLQNIVLRPNTSQNIAINLSDYVSKIDTFKIIIEETEYIEIGRNNVFVIFNINSINIKEDTGKYNLIDNDGNYISSGNWTIS